jgi:hypothetical protein
VDWMDLTQDREQRRDFVNTVMNLWFPKKAGNFLTPTHGVSQLVN